MIFTNTNINFSFRSNIELSSATEPTIHFKKPNDERGTWTANIVNNKIEYKTVSGDLDIAGTWEFQPSIKVNGDLLKGEIIKQEIKQSIN